MAVNSKTTTTTKKKMLIYYSSVAMSVTVTTNSPPRIRILAEHINRNNGDVEDEEEKIEDNGEEALAALALRCLESLPPLHDSFSYTANDRMFACLIAQPYLFCAIADEALSRSAVMAFLNELRREFVQSYVQDQGESSDDVVDMDQQQLQDRRFRDDFRPVFVKLLATVTMAANTSATSSPDRCASETLRTQQHAYGDGGKPNWDIESGLLRVTATDLAGRNGVQVLTMPPIAIVNGAAIARPSRRPPVLLFCYPWKRRNVQSRSVEVRLDAETEEEANPKLPVAMATSHQGRALCSRNLMLILLFDAIACIILFCIWMAICKGLHCIK